MSDRETDGKLPVERIALSIKVESQVFGASLVPPGMDVQGPCSCFCSGEMFSEQTPLPQMFPSCVSPGTCTAQPTRAGGTYLREPRVGEAGSGAGC